MDDRVALDATLGEFRKEQISCHHPHSDFEGMVKAGRFRVSGLQLLYFETKNLSLTAFNSKMKWDWQRSLELAWTPRCLNKAQCCR